MFELIFADTNRDVCFALERAFSGVDYVRVENSRFQDIPVWDCVVSPANSFGIMDGGFDLHLSRFFGPSLQRKVQAGIFVYYAGMQPIGTSLLVETEHPNHYYVAHTPTMFVPMPITGSINVFFAMKAALQEIMNHNDNGGGEEKRFIRRVLCPGLGTATGGVPYDVAAYQMRLAYNMVFFPPKRMNWEIARQIQLQLAGGKV